MCKRQNKFWKLKDSVVPFSNVKKNFSIKNLKNKNKKVQKTINDTSSDSR